MFRPFLSFFGPFPYFSNVIDVLLTELMYPRWKEAHTGDSATFFSELRLNPFFSARQSKILTFHPNPCFDSSHLHLGPRFWAAVSSKDMIWFSLFWALRRSVPVSRLLRLLIWGSSVAAPVSYEPQTSALIPFLGVQVCTMPYTLLAFV